QVEWTRAGNEGERVVFVPAFGAEMDGHRRLVILAGNPAIELGVFLLGDFAFRLHPQGRAVRDFAAFGLGLLYQRDGDRHMAGLFLDQALELVWLRIVRRVLHQMQHDARTALRRLVGSRRRDLVGTLAVGGPAPGLFASRLAGDDVDLVGDHEGRIEADTELADQLGALAGFRGLDALHEGARAGAGDGAERLDQFVAAHADAVVLDRQTL